MAVLISDNLNDYERCNDNNEDYDDDDDDDDDDDHNDEYTGSSL